MMMMNATTPTMMPMSLGSTFFALLAPVFQVIKYMIVRYTYQYIQNGILDLNKRSVEERL